MKQLKWKKCNKLNVSVAIWLETSESDSFYPEKNCPFNLSEENWPRNKTKMPMEIQPDYKR